MGATSKFFVYDKEYELRGTCEDADGRLSMVVELVDRRMKELATCHAHLNAKSIAILTALNLADYYIEMQERALPDPELNAEAFADCNDVRLPVYIEKIEAFLESKGR